MSTAPTILFDLDGTLADTALDLTETMNVILERHGRPRVPHDEVRGMVGGGARKIMERGFAATGDPADDALLDRVFEEFLDYYGAHIADHTVVFDALPDALSRLQSAGVRLGVVTNKVEHLSLSVLDALDLRRFFPVVIGGDTLPVKKPDPEPLFEAVRRLGGDPGAAIMVGDSAYDVDAAKAAEFPVIAVSFGYTQTPVHELGADIVIDHYRDFLPALASLLPPALLSLDLG